MEGSALDVTTRRLPFIKYGTNAAEKSAYRTADFSTLPAENLGTFAAGIFKDSPVRGFLPIRAFRFEIVNVPKLTSDTRWPFFKEDVTAPVKAWSAFPAATLVIPADAAIFAINSSFVIIPSFYKVR
jgi:hypothetical protein